MERYSTTPHSFNIAEMGLKDDKIFIKFRKNQNMYGIPYGTAVARPAPKTEVYMYTIEDSATAERLYSDIITGGIAVYPDPHKNSKGHSVTYLLARVYKINHGTTGRNVGVNSSGLSTGYQRFENMGVPDFVSVKDEGEYPAPEFPNGGKYTGNYPLPGEQFAGSMPFGVTPKEYQDGVADGTYPDIKPEDVGEPVAAPVQPAAEEHPEPAPEQPVAAPENTPEEAPAKKSPDEIAAEEQDLPENVRNWNKQIRSIFNTVTATQIIDAGNKLCRAKAGSNTSDEPF